MSWELSGRWVEMCSCKMYCPCNFGPAEPTQGWCSASLLFDIDRGSANGTDLSGAKLALQAELPGDFMGGMDKAKLYLNDSLSEKQRSELEAIFQGKNGGPWEAINAGIRQWLPSQVTKVEVNSGDKPSFSVGDLGQGALERMKSEDGKQAKVVDAPLSGGFQVSVQELATAAGGWKDPALRQWESAGNGAVVAFSWKV